MYIITQYAKVLKRRTRILTKKYRLYAAFSVFLLLQLSNFRVVTSKKPPMLRRGLDCLQLTPYFDATVALGDTKESKPHPEPMLAACAKLGVKQEECLCVGDSPFDLQSGRSAGTKTVAVRYTAFGWEKLLEEGRPDFVIARPQELLELVEK